MAVKIALFNHKGGVSKTTTTFNIGWMLAEKGKKVILVDADPQCNLTGLILGYDYIDLEEFYKKGTNNNLRDGLAPAFESMPKLIEAVECIHVKGRDGLFLLPGHIRLAGDDAVDPSFGRRRKPSYPLLFLAHHTGFHFALDARDVLVRGAGHFSGGRDGGARVRRSLAARVRA